MALWKDKISDEKHEEIPRLSDSLFEKNQKVFELLLFSATSLEDLVSKSKIRELQQKLGTYMQFCTAP